MSNKTADELVICQALREVIDRGDPDHRRGRFQDRLPWAIDHAFPAVAEDARLRFAEAVLDRIRALKAPDSPLPVSASKDAPERYCDWKA